MSEFEFSRRVPLDTIGGGGRDEAFEASVEERAALAKRFGWIAVEALSGEARLTRVAGGVQAAGTLKARIVQRCAATDAPVAEDIAEPFDLRFVEQFDATEGEEIELAEGDLDTLPIEDGAIDLGEAAAQTLALAANPYPRCDNVEDVGLKTGPANGAFAGLKGLLKP